MKALRILQNFIAPLLGVAVWAGCSTGSVNKSHLGCVSRVDYKEVPQAEQLAVHIRELGDRVYPQVRALLDDGKTTLPKRFDVCFKKELSNENAGVTRFDHIYLNGSYLEDWEKDPATFDSVLIHEMGHVAQHYDWPILGRWLVYQHYTPTWLIEGIADYVSFKLGDSNSWRCAECTSDYPDYKDGYTCGGALLMYLEKSHPGIVADLNKHLRLGGYSDALFTKLTGKDLQTHWSEFQKTAAFTPEAARMLALEQSLGFVDDKPPRDLEQKLQDYMKNRLDESTRKLIAGVKFPGSSASRPRGRMALLLYFTQPGGTAESFITDLKDNNKLPGFAKSDHGTLSVTLNARDLSPKYPVVRSFTAEKPGDAGSIYHYTVRRDTQASDWTLQRAWRSSVNGKFSEEYSVSKISEDAASGAIPTQPVNGPEAN